MTTTKKRAATAEPKKDTKGNWGFRVDVPGPDGQRRQARRRGFSTKKEAQAELDKIRGQAREKTYAAPKRQSVREFLENDWLPTQRRHLADSTFESYQRNIRLHVVPRLGGLQLSSVDGTVLDKLYSDLLENGRKRGQQQPGLKPRTVRYIHTILSGAFGDAVKSRRITVNPASQATPPSASEAKAPEMKVWSAPQVRQFLELCEGDRYYYPFAFLALTGCRRGEGLGIRWSDIDWERKTAAIRQTVLPLSRPGGVGREGRILPRTKTDRARVVEMDLATLSMLKMWKARQAEERLMVGPGYEDNGLVFCRPDGRPYHPEAFSKTFDRRLRQAAFAELPVLHLHGLRHTWATLALAAGVDVAIVARRLGHGSPATTWATYQHVVPGMQADAAEKVAALIFGA